MAKPSEVPCNYGPYLVSKYPEEGESSEDLWRYSLQLTGDPAVLSVLPFQFPRANNPNGTVRRCTHTHIFQITDDFLMATNQLSQLIRMVMSFKTSSLSCLVI
jgi:hypothetical protein